jgi:ATP-dependent Lon protease
MSEDVIFDSLEWLDEAGTSPNPSLAEKARAVFGDLVIDKRRYPMSQLGKRGVPAYVGEWVLEHIVPGEGMLTPEEQAKLRAWADKYVPLPSDQNLIKHRLLSGEIVKVLTPMQVEITLKRNRQERVAVLSLLGIDDAQIRDDLVEKYPALLKQGMWGIVELVNTEDGVLVSSFKPMQASVNLELFKQARREFTLKEWRNLMLISMGYNPETLAEEEATWLLCRLLPLVMKNMHLIELAPKGTGKSYLFENIHNRVRLVSGGNITPAVLFVNNATGQWGLLARFAVVVLDEVQRLRFEKPAEIIGGLKGYLANGRLTRGGLHETSSDCSFVMLANIALDTQQRPLNSSLLENLPEFLRETAFIDRLRGILPGWRVRKLTQRDFAESVGLKADFFGEVLLALREDLTLDQYCARRVALDSANAYKRNYDALVSIAAGLMKIQFPDGIVSDEEFDRYCVRPAREMRELVWRELQQLDAEYRQYDSAIYYKILPEE